jgi:hypothetical protein
LRIVVDIVFVILEEVGMFISENLTNGNEADDDDCVVIDALVGLSTGF